ncbi:MAG: GEVED domain-containing protein [Chitinophagales bacterium]
MKKSLLILLTVFAVSFSSIQSLQAQYCIPYYWYESGSSGYGWYINRVVLNTLDYTSGADASYNDFTAYSTTLDLSTSYTITVYDGSWGDYYMAWIDYDQDGTFETSEEIFTSEEYTSTSTSESFTVPATAAPGATRLRVMGVYYYYSSMEPCPESGDYYYYGETEDYTIYIPNTDANDLGVTSITSLATGCGLGSETVTVNLFNAGTDDASSFDVAYQIDDPVLGLLTPVVESYTGSTIASLEEGTYTFSTPADLSNIGNYTIKAYTIISGDDTYTNDTSEVSLTSIPVISTFPAVEDFEDGESGWIHYGSSSSWELGEPDATTITGPPPGTPTSIKSWATNLDGYYAYYEASYCESPCYDFTSLVLPYVEFDIWWATYDFYDGAQLEYSLDAGVSWDYVGDISTGDNWYTGPGYSLGWTGSIYEPGWVGSGGGWKTAHHDLTFLAGEPQVKFRFRFAGSWYPYYDGIAFDNFTISEPFPDDLGVIALIDPVSTTSLGSAETVTVEVQNFGTNSQSDFTVYYQVNTGTIHSDVYSGTLLPGESGMLTFTDTEDFSVIGPYDFCSWTALPGDDDITNDSLCTTVHHLTPVSGSNTYYIHLSTEDPFSSSDNIDKMDEVFGAGAWEEKFFDTLDPDSVFNVNTCFVYIDGGSYTAVEFKDFLEENITAIEDWVSSGGNLFLNAAPYEGGSIELGFDGTKLWYPSYVYSGEATDPSFPIFEGPHTPVGTEWYGWWYSFAHARITGDMTELINDYWTTTNYVLGFKEWGDGAVLFGTMTPAEYHTPADEAGNLRKNIFEFLKYCSPVDLGVIAVNAPDVSGCGLDSMETISVIVENFGPTVVSSFPVNVSVDGAAPIVEVATPIIESGFTGAYTFSTTADLSALGLHTLEIWTDVYVDEDHTNDTLFIEITNLEAPDQNLGEDTSVCDIITLDAGNPGMIYAWSTGETSQTIDQTNSGVTWVSVTHPSTGCVVNDTIDLEVTYTPAAMFDAVVAGLTVTFTNMSSTGALYTWYFGDGTYSNEFSPTHTFTANAYTVVLVAENECGYSYFDTILYVGVDPTVALNDISLETRTVLYPNPVANFLQVAMNFDAYYNVGFELINTKGQVVLTELAGKIKEGNYQLNVSDIPSGAYQLLITANEHKYAKPVIISKE